MARPSSSSDTVLRPALSICMQEFLEQQDEFIGLKIYTPFGVENDHAEYPVVTIEALLRVPETRRGSRADYPRGDWEFETDTYDTRENGWEEPVSDVEAEQYSVHFEAEEIAAKIGHGIILRNQEKRVADALFNAGNFTPHAVTDEWDHNHYSDATPMADVLAGRFVIHDACGAEPNTLIVTLSTFHHLGLMNEIIDKLKYTYTPFFWGENGRKLLADAFGLEQILVGKAMRNTAKKGQAAVLTQIWNDEYAMLCVTAAEGEKDIMAPAIGRTFHWTKDVPENILVESYREESKRSTIIRSRQHTDEKLILTAAGYLLSNITT